MSRTSRLLELMILVRARGRFTVEGMAAEVGVSRRTMLRDLQALSEMGVPLAATPGPGGGYSLIASARMLPLTLTVDEAIGLVISYESFMRLAETPFAVADILAITKLRNAMPPDVVARLDLQALSEMGVPLAATPGPGGGYSLIASARMLPLTLTVDEAIGLVISYESFMRLAETPFAVADISAITKLRNAMPPEVVARLDLVRACVSMLGPDRVYRAPHLDALLTAAVDGVHLRIMYASRSRTLERLIFPLGLYAADGYWYVACYDYPREQVLALRADRVTAMERIEGLVCPTDETLRDYLATYRSGATDMAPLRARVSRGVAFSYDFQTLFGEVELGEGETGLLDTSIPLSEIDFYAPRLVALGPGIRVESPPELVAAMIEIARGVIDVYASRRR